MGVLVPLAVVWVAVLIIMALGVEGDRRDGRGLHPLLILAVHGACGAFFSPLPPVFDAGCSTLNWSPNGWHRHRCAAFGQILLRCRSASASWLPTRPVAKRTDDRLQPGRRPVELGFRTVVGIGVFATLGPSLGLAVDEVASEGLGLCLRGLPDDHQRGPAGALIGVLFFPDRWCRRSDVTGPA